MPPENSSTREEARPDLLPSDKKQNAYQFWALKRLKEAHERFEKATFFGEDDEKKVSTFSSSPPGARVNFFAGLDPGDPPLELDVRAVHYQALSLFGSVNSTPRQNADALRLIATKSIDLARLVTARLPLAKLADAMQLATSPAHLKVIIEPE